MKRKTAVRTLLIIANALLLSCGSVISVIRPSMDDKGALVSVFAVVMCGMMLIILIIECVTAVKVHDSSLHTAVIAFFLLLFMLFSPDMYGFFSKMGAHPPAELFDLLDQLFYTCAALSVAMFFRHTYRPHGKKVRIAPMFAVGILCMGGYAALAPLKLQYIALACFVSTLAGWYAVMRYAAYRNGLDNTAFYFASAIYACVSGMQAVNAFYRSGLIAGCVGWSIIYFWLILICFCVIYLVYFLRNEGAALLLNKCRLQNEQLKMKVLVGQINPHLIFNALTTIKSRYHGDMAAGDNALGLFSEYMRESLSLIDTEIIPFEHELKNISHYIDFINTSQVRPFNIIYNIDVTDFCVPAFSLQPFIKNAVKCSKVNESEDGYIMISTMAEGELARIEISDNGVGFDTPSISKGAHGINNSRERFRLLFDTEPVIQSREPSGTKITITVKRSTEGCKHEDNRR